MRFKFSVLFTLLACCVVISSCSNSTDSSFVPTIDFTLPSAVVNASVVGADETYGTSNCNEISNWAFRTDRVVTQINNVLQKMNDANIKAAGNFSFTTSAGTITGSVTALTGDANYNYEAIVCFNNTLFHYLKWDSANTKVYSYRDHGVDPVGAGNSSVMKSEIVYEKGTSQDTLSFYVYGVPWAVPADVSSSVSGGTYLAEYAVAAKTTAGVYSIKGTRAWESAERTSINKTDAFTGDVYFTGMINADSSAISVIYRVFNPSLCAGSFNESTPNWCFSANVSAAGVASLTTNTSTNWTTLQSVGVAPSASLKVVEAPSGKTCPAL